VLYGGELGSGFRGVLRKGISIFEKIFEWIFG